MPAYPWSSSIYLFIFSFSGLHVVVTMFTGYLLGYAAFRALFNHSPAMVFSKICLPLLLIYPQLVWLWAESLFFVPFFSILLECCWRNSWVGGCHACWDFPFHYQKFQCWSQQNKKVQSKTEISLFHIQPQEESVELIKVWLFYGPTLVTKNEPTKLYFSPLKLWTLWTLLSVINILKVVITWWIVAHLPWSFLWKGLKCSLWKWHLPCIPRRYSGLSESSYSRVTVCFDLNSAWHKDCNIASLLRSLRHQRK